MALRTDVRGLEAAWNAVEDAMADDETGPTVDRGDGEWVASVFPPVTPAGYTPSPIEGAGDTPQAALQALEARLSSDNAR